MIDHFLLIRDGLKAHFVHQFTREYYDEEYSCYDTKKLIEHIGSQVNKNKEADMKVNLEAKIRAEVLAQVRRELAESNRMLD